MSNLHHLRQSIQVEAARLGFDLFGITTPEPPPHGAAYLNWLSQARHGDMAYLSDERSRAHRLDPRQVLDGCQSIIIVAMRYSPPAPRAREECRRDRGPASAPPAPLVGEGGRGDGGPALTAAYAYGLDYHDLIPPRLAELAHFIEGQLEHPIAWKAYTDTGPILERDLAQRAGLGWIGKNTLLINPQLGSYFFLAELFLDVPLPPDDPFVADRCGSCTRCLEACPTQCILPDRTLDARRCISYLTIENKGDIPEELRPQVGAWAFGCDVCQQVCPWNLRFASPPRETAFQPVEPSPHPDLADELSLDAQGFNRKFKGRPQKRAKRRGYLRNLAVAAGNTGGPEVVPVLQAAAQDEEPLVRRHAGWALQQIEERLSKK